jgi:pyruvate decarboxylase
MAVPGCGVNLRCSYGTIGALRDIAEALGGAVAVMPDAKGLFPEDHPQYTGPRPGTSKRWPAR